MMEEGKPRQRTIGDGVALVVLFGSFAGFFAGLWRFVAHNVVDVPYWDLWDLLDPWFRDAGLWTAATQRHGTVLQGLGAPLVAATNALTGWDVRALSFEIVVILLVAALLAVELKVRLYGRVTIADALIPPLFFRLVQGSGIVLVPYAACVALPLVFVLLACRALLVRNERLRLAALGLVSLLAMCTGFSMFVPPVLVVALVMRGAIEWRSGGREGMRSSARAALVVALGMVPALLRFDRRSFGEIACPDGAPSAVDYAAYVMTMVNGSFGAFDRSDAALVAGAALLLPLLAIALVGLARISRPVGDEGREANASRALVPVVLVGFSLVFSLSTALGRICADGAALNSRYLGLMAPLGLGLYFGLLGWEPFGARARTARAAAIAALALTTAFSAPRISEFDGEVVEASVTGKLRWIACAKSGGTAAECNRRAQFAIHPMIPATRVDDKIDFLRSRELSFFARRDPGPPK